MRAVDPGDHENDPTYDNSLSDNATPDSSSSDDSGDDETADGGVSRRGILGGLLAAPILAGSVIREAAAAPAVEPAGVPAADAAAALPAQAAAAAPAPRVPHGVDLRGLDVAVRTTRTTEARFGLMFKTLPAYGPPDALLEQLAQKMVDQTPPVNDVRLSQDGFNHPGLPAGFVYFGQFVDHDMTMDQTPLAQQQTDASATVNFDTPWFDLGSMYGKGPTGSPELYVPGGLGLLRLDTHDGFQDLPRDTSGAAYLGDPRNDENLIVAQLHVAFIKLHNQFMAAGRSFADAQKLTRWHYQWVIVNDYLPRIVGQSMVDSVLTRLPSGAYRYAGKFYRPRDTRRPFMPVEYSAAAYRWGHSSIRAEYEMHDIPGSNPTVTIFSDSGQDLRGSRPVPADLWADWNYFFDIPGLSRPDDRNQARKIDTKLSLPLATLPPTVVGTMAGVVKALAERNLKRGKNVGLPAGQDVATAMGLTPLLNTGMGLTDAGWGGKAPLWFYVLKEAELGGSLTLGPVGGRIVAEVILGILSLDPGSYINSPTPWTPSTTLPYRIGNLLRLAGAIDPRVDAAAAVGAAG